MNPPRLAPPYAELFSLLVLLAGLSYVIFMRLAFSADIYAAELTGYVRMGCGTALVIGFGYLIREPGARPYGLLLLLCAALIMDLVFFGLFALVAAGLAAVSIWRNSNLRPAQGIALFALALLLLFFNLNGHAATIWLPLLPELVASNRAPMDMLFHVALAKMLGSYGVVSLGIDGVVPFNYHALNHLLVAGQARGFGLSVEAVFGSFYPLFATPLLTYAVLSLMGRLRLLQGPYPFIAFLGDLGWVFIIMSIGLWQAFASETYAASLLLIFAILHILVNVQLRRSVGPWDILILAGLVLLCSLVKMPSGFGAMALVGSFFVVRGGWRPLGFGLGTLSAGLPFAISMLYFLSGPGTLGVPVEPFVFLFKDPQFSIPSLVLVGILLWWQFRHQTKPTALAPLTQACLWASLALVVVSAIFNAGAGSTAYFINQIIWLFLPVMALMTPAHRFRGGLSWALLVVVALLSVVKLDRRLLRAFEPDLLLSRTWVSETPTGKIREYVQDQNALIDGIFVDHQVHEFWDGSPNCRAAPMGLVAATGIPMLQGHPPTDRCPRNDGHGYHVYPVDRALASPLPENANERARELCRRAATRGMSTLLDVQPDKMSVLHCDNIE
ncbi:hypothetical protein [Pseudogemmobacter sp. W21_MBD1_M6]|uniref:hypothetical protein n=1 Tax=Pseudogemmobacter sp. W21_MBD1_M6 TaxID=3240271 RepID=UPI003F982FDE